MSHVSPKAWINVMQCKMETGRARSPWHLWEAWKLFSSSLWRYRMWSCWGPATAWTAGACLGRSHGVRKLLEGALREDLSSSFFCKGLSWLGFWGPLPACRRCFRGFSWNVISRLGSSLGGTPVGIWIQRRFFALRERYRQALTQFGSWSLANNWTQAFMVLHHDLFPWSVHLIIDVISDKIVRGWSSMQVAGTRFMTQVMTELQKDELAAYPVNTYEYIYDRELAEGMASTATRLDWGVTNGSTKKRRGAKSLGAFDLRTYMMNLQQSL